MFLYRFYNSDCNRNQKFAYASVSVFQLTRALSFAFLTSIFSYFSVDNLQLKFIACGHVVEQGKKEVVESRICRNAVLSLLLSNQLKLEMRLLNFRGVEKTEN